MKRYLEKDLLEWSSSPVRMPLLLRGARQTGKTFLVETFAKKHFQQLVAVNFELMPELKMCFERLEPQWILTRLQLLLGKKIIPGQTLLFLDEIQDCPQAIQALRYFKEQLPELHVIGAGSLLEFSLNQDGFRMPVGRVESRYLKPMSFMEFLSALNEEPVYEYLSSLTIEEAIPDAIHDKLTNLVKLYSVIGGMPAVVQSYIDTKDLTTCQHIQRQLLNTYRNDFSKYASNAYQQHCEKVFRKAPNLIAQHIKYVDIDPDVQSRFLKQSLLLLKQAGILHFVFATKATGLPLNALLIEKKYKLLFLDIGLVNCATNLSSETLLSKDLLLVNKGKIAEQFVGQELLAYQDTNCEAEVFYWERNVRNSKAEVDYVVNFNSKIIPIEVKAGRGGRLKSIQYFMKGNNVNLGVVISQRPLYYQNNILYVPFYLVGHLLQLILSLNLPR